MEMPSLNSPLMHEEVTVAHGRAGYNLDCIECCIGTWRDISYISTLSSAAVNGIKFASQGLDITPQSLQPADALSRGSPGGSYASSGGIPRGEREGSAHSMTFRGGTGREPRPRHAIAKAYA